MASAIGGGSMYGGGSVLIGNASGGGGGLGGGLGGSVIIGSASAHAAGSASASAGASQVHGDRPAFETMGSVYLDPSASFVDAQRHSQRISRSRTGSNLETNPNPTPNLSSGVGLVAGASTAAASTTATVVGSRWRCHMTAMAVLSAPSADLAYTASGPNGGPSDSLVAAAESKR